jgi:DNA-binding CsgD family transcriptional regulator
MFACDRSQRIVLWNDAVERLVGLPRAEAVGKFCWEVLRATDPGGALACGAHCRRARLGAHGWPVEPQELDVASDHGRRRVVVDTVTVQDEDARTVLHVLHSAAGAAEGGSDTGAPRLTPRQLEVLRLLAEGKPAKQIARELWLSEATVRNHIRAILRELEAHSQLEAVSKARRRGLVA